MTLLINIDYILKWFLIYIYIYVCMYVCMHENFNNRVLVGVEFKFWYLNDKVLSKLNYC